MSAATLDSVNVQLPSALRRSMEELAQREGISLDQFIASAAAEKLAAWQGLEYLRAEARLGKPEDLKRYLAAVPDAEPIETDRLPEGYTPL